MAKPCYNGCRTGESESPAWTPVLTIRDALHSRWDVEDKAGSAWRRRAGPPSKPAQP